jgi:ATP-dependent DNA helicase RecG
VLFEPCHVLPGVGAQVTKLLAKCGIMTLQDLLLHLPHRYQDRTRVTPVRDLRFQDWAVVVGKISHIALKRSRRPTLECFIQDGTGILKLRFFHFNASVLEALQVGVNIRVFGEVRALIPYPEMVHPEYKCSLDAVPRNQGQGSIEVEETLTPIYSTTQGLTQTRLRTLVKTALSQFEPVAASLEWMNQTLLDKCDLYPFHLAIQCLHHPPPDTPLSQLEQGSHPAIKRIVFEELLVERLSLEFAKQARRQKVAPVCAGSDELTTAFLQQLPFALTGAQARVSEEILHDLSHTKPMLRLIQGDVGSGKTVVAVLALLRVVASGYQVAMMVPTDLLSEQHATNLLRWLAPLGIVVKQLNGKLSLKVRRQILSELQAGECQVLVGTHALFQDSVEFKQLGLIIIDEQHRFGVEQRLALEQKGRHGGQVAHQLLMTATPIPRTLRMTQWAHLDVSVIDELPPTRTPIVTAVMSCDKREAVLVRLRQAIQAGRQAYWVCTLIEESEKLQCQAATDTAAQLIHELAPFRVGLVHGRMKADEKEQVLAAFRAKALDLLVATTVIEVGVDVPNASLMIIENAERLGLAQLHQLRGRVGRGAVASSCVLLYQPPLSSIGIARLHTMRETTDGFEIAEQDLRLRGGGELLGTKQTGYRTYKVANLTRDQHLLPMVAKVAKWLVKSQPALAKSISTRWAGEVNDFLRG